MAEKINPLRSLYVAINDQLDHDELEKMKCLLHGLLSKSEIEKSRSVLGLLMKLEDKGHLKLADLEVLKKLLEEIERKPLIDLVDKCNEAKENQSPAAVAESNDSEDSLKWSAENISGPTSGDIRALEFKKPNGVVFQDDCTVICDRDNYRVCVLDKHWKLLYLLQFDGLFAKTFQPWDVAVSVDNHFFVTDTGNQQGVVCGKTSKLIRTFANDDDIEPWAIAVMSRFVFVTDRKGDRVIKYTVYGEYVREVGRKGNLPGEFNGPFGVAVNSLNRVLVSDFYNHRVQVFDSELQLLFIFGSSGLVKTLLALPYGMSVDDSDNVYVCDRGRARVVKFKPDGSYICSLFDGELRNQVRYISVQTDNDDRVIRTVVTERYTDVLKVYTKSV